MQIVTGKTETDHVKPEYDRAKHAGTHGTGEYVLNVGSKFAASVEPSNTIKIADGDGMMQGTHFTIPHGTYDEVTIDNGTSGYIRKDLIVVRYTREGELEETQLVVIKGEPSASDPQTPECTSGNILEGAALAEMPLYVVTVDCTATEMTISVSEPLFDVSTGLDDVYRKNEVYNKGEAYSKTEVYSKSETYTKGQVDSIKTTLQSSINTAQSTANTAVQLANTNKSEIASVEDQLLSEIHAVQTDLSGEIDSLRKQVAELASHLG